MTVDMSIKANRVRAIRLATLLHELAEGDRHIFNDAERESLRDAALFLATLVDKEVEELGPRAAQREGGGT
jgi:hypothetical protein